MADLMTELLDFRTVWMRAVAQAWIDDNYKASLKADPKKALKEGFDYDWQWSTIDFTIKEDPNFKWVSARSGLCVHRRKTWYKPFRYSLKSKWDWTFTKENECITLSLPLTPPKNYRPELHALALADFYNSQPTLFGTDVSRVLKRAKKNPQIAADLVVPGAADRNANPNMPYIGSVEEFSNFQVAVITFISICWKSNGIPDRNDNPTKALAKALFSGLDPKYRVPWEMMIMVQNDTQTSWDPVAREWKDGSPHVLKMLLPTKPPEASDYAVALASYNATGAEYPFTCCCAC
jgi:ribosomally synthesized peptide (two-chain TOMM family)